MSATSSKQWRPLAIREADAEAALSVRAVRDLAEGMNNYQEYVCADKLFSEIWRDDTGAPGPQSPEGVTAETVALCPMPPVYISRAKDQVVWTIRHRRLTGTGSITWTLYAAKTLYKGPEAFDVTYLSKRTPPAVKSSTITTSSDTPRVESAYLSLAGIRGLTDLVYLLLTATAEGVGDRSRVTQLDITAMP